MIAMHMNPIYLLYSIFSLLSMHGILLVFLLVQKRKQQTILARKRQLRDKLKPWLLRVLRDGADEKTRMFQKKEIVYEVLEELIDDVAGLIKDDLIHERIRTFAETHFADYFRRRLRHTRWSIRMNTLYRIEDFHMACLEEELWDRLDIMKDAYERFQLLRTLASIQSNRLAEQLTERNNGWPKFLCKDLIERYDEVTFARMIHRFEHSGPAVQEALVDLIGKKRLFTHLPIVLQQLKSDSMELRLAALRALLQIGYVPEMDILIPYAKSGFWEERMIFAQLCLLLKKELFKPLLVELISDQNWFVRNAAGKALSAFQDGDIILGYISETHSDPFARDMAKQWLESENKE